ncbi:hypothetical protein [Streptomyces sp. RKAG337]|uniref:hypothetical protein n=1 Tax=Streptomyces sp. RKAG337 TaxID=2893404 RepID=UPI0020341B8F|nr:hypothetical protein [Streptomyces sp. RKAG337]MCM2426152.1 hypothetical protein [Streptomyces sp. RKAG337]
MTRYLISFLPWIAYAFVATSDDWRKGALVGLGIATVVIWRDRKSGKNWDEMVIETSAFVFFAGIAWLSYAQPDSDLVRYGPALVDAWLALTAWGSLLIRRPFTLGIARKLVPEKVARTEAFYQTNAVITQVWGLAFAAAAVVLAFIIRADAHATTPMIVVKVASFVIPVLFTIRYPKAVAARRAHQTA